jgi:organic hydroperoxide reductase OsmC/OhrA
MTEPSKPAGRFSLRVEQVNGFELRVRFDKPTHPDLLLDEPPPLSGDRGPNPSRLLAASIASCLSASLIFCLRKAKIETRGLVAEVDTELVRNEQRRLRVGKVSVRLMPQVSLDSPAFTQCLESFEDFCVVTESVRQGIDVHVAVESELAS